MEASSRRRTCHRDRCTVGIEHIPGGRSHIVYRDFPKKVWKAAIVVQAEAELLNVDKELGDSLVGFQHARYGSDDRLPAFLELLP